MLLGSGRRHHTPESSTDSVHNFYEHLVFEEISRVSEKANTDSDFLSDVACVALNQLPPRYVRHDVDMTFFMTPGELEDIHKSVAEAVHASIRYVESRSCADEPSDEHVTR